MITIEQIKKLNAERTQGEWSFNRAPMQLHGFRPMPRIQILLNPGTKTIVEMPSRNTSSPDADFIAAAPAIAELCIKQAEEIEIHRQRLEIAHVWDSQGNKFIPDFEIPDGIFCRDETIKLLEDKNQQLTAENKGLRNTLLELKAQAHKRLSLTNPNKTEHKVSQHILKIINEAINKEPK